MSREEENKYFYVPIVINWVKIGIFLIRMLTRGIFTDRRDSPVLLEAH